MISALGYLGFTSPNYRDWEWFGPEVLGSPLAEDGPDGAVRLRFDDRHHRVAVHPGERNAVAYIGWETRNEDDYLETLEHLEVASVKFRPGSDEECADRSVERMARFADPAGFVHEIFHGPEQGRRSFLATRPMAGFVTGDQGLGHCVVVVPDGTEADRFFRQVLGFRLSDAPEVIPGKIRGYFYRCNPRHHSFAVVGIPQSRSFSHLLVEVAELDDVGIAYDIAQERGIPITRSLGRHPTDNMVSFYMRTPSGFALEYGWGGLRINEDDWVVVRPTAPEVWGHKVIDQPDIEPVEPIEQV